MMMKREQRDYLKLSPCVMLFIALSIGFVMLLCGVFVTQLDSTSVPTKMVIRDGRPPADIVPLQLQHDEEVVALQNQHVINASISTIIPHTTTILTSERNILSESAEIVEQAAVLSHFVPSKEKQNIILDWPIDDRLFTIDNFKSLESLLSVYPDASLKVLLASGVDAYLHKTGNLLPVTFFDKYKKRNYDLSIDPVGTMNGFQAKISHGAKYWGYWKELCCKKCNKACRTSDHTQPFHVLTFIRLTKLLMSGGLFSDFSFLFLGPLDDSMIQQGYYSNSYCIDSKYFERWQEKEANESGDKSKKLVSSPRFHGTATIQSCFTSTAMKFPQQRGNPVIRCVLNQYDNYGEESAFFRCIDEDATFGGAKCISDVFAECFRKVGIDNQFDETDKNNSIIETFGGDAEVARHFLISKELMCEGNSELCMMKSMGIVNRIRSEGKRIVWLGSLAVTGHWDLNYYQKNQSAELAASGQPPVSKGLHGDSILSLISSQIVLRDGSFFNRSGHTPVQAQLRKTTPMDNNTSMGISTDDVCSLTRTQPCHHYSTSLELLSSKGFTEMSYKSGLEEASCAPSIIVAGFMKSASSFLFNTLVKHPQVLSPLIGSQLKETYCYMGNIPGALRNRMWCFPYISPYENFHAGDGTVYYGVDSSVPYTLKADNPNVKVIFVVRHPVDRLYSNYKFGYQVFKKFGVFDDFVDPGMKQTGKFGRLRELLMHGMTSTPAADDIAGVANTTVQQMMELYFHEKFMDGPGPLAVLFMHSLPVFGVLHYQHVLGK